MRLGHVIDAFAAIFVVGIALAVYVLVRGVERGHSPNASRHQGRSTAAGLRFPFAAALTLTFGLVGYLAARPCSPYDAGLDTPNQSDALGDQALLGYVGILVSAASAGRDAEVEYWFDDRRILSRARDVEHTELQIGTDVVIERIDGNVVYVEAWSRVEQRI